MMCCVAVCCGVFVILHRTTSARLKQQVDSTTRSLALCQRELETIKLRESITTTTTTTSSNNNSSTEQQDVFLSNNNTGTGTGTGTGKSSGSGRVLRRQATIGGMTSPTREKTVKFVNHPL